MIKILIDFYLQNSELGDVGAVQSTWFINTLMLFVVGMVRVRLLLLRTVSSPIASTPISSHYCCEMVQADRFGGVVVDDIASV